MRAAIAIASAAALTSAAFAGPPVVGPQPAAPVDTSAFATKAQVAAIQAAVPVPADSVPPTEMVGGAAGSAPTFRRGDAANPRITRAGMVTTDASGGWSITWSAATAAIPVVLPIPVNATAQPIICNVITRSTTGATGRCWLARQLPAALIALSALISYDVFAASASTISVQVLAIPPTQ